MKRESEDAGARVVGHLIEILSGRCTITKDDILACEAAKDHSLAQILTGLTYLHEDLVYREQQRAQALKSVREQNEILRRSEERFRVLVQEVKDYAIFRLDPEGRIDTWNAGAERLKGYRAEEIIGQHFSRFYTPEDLAAGKPARELETAAAEGRVADEGWRLRKDGSRFWADVVITALHDEKGSVRGFAKVTRDLTQRRKAEEKFRGLLEAAPDAMVIADPSGRIVLVNTQAESLFGYAREEMLGQPIEILLPERYRRGHVAQRDGYFREPRPRAMGAGLELYGRRKDGAEFAVEISLSPLETEDGTWAMSAIRDVTERKKAEDELRRVNAELANANADLETFSYSAAHDLRAPVRHISGFAKLLIEEHGPKLGGEVLRYLEKIQAGARHMGALIDDLLRLANVGRQPLAREDAPLDEILRAALKEVEPEAAGRDVEWRLGELGRAECDPGLVRQVFVNLLSNALKYSRTRARTVIEAGRTADDPRAYFVRDNGVGFDMQYAGKLFKVFSRLHAPRDFEGTGVGLATVERILRKHGGRIWAEAEPDRGATFFFTLSGGDK